jgi:putative membrane protein
MRRLLIQIAIGIIGIWLANQFIEGVSFRGTFQQLILVGSILGLVNFFLKPIVQLITFPLRLLTLGLFTFIINMLMIEIVDILFPELTIVGIVPLFWTAVLLWGLGIVIPLFVPKRVKRPATPNLSS